MSPRPIVCLVLFISFTLAASAQTAQKTIDEYLQAQGGAKALAQIRTETIAGSLTEKATGRVGSWALITKTPNRFYSEIIVGQDRQMEAYNGMSAWGQNSPDAARTLTGEAAKQVEGSSLYWNNRLADIRKARITAQLLGIEKVRGQDTYHVRVTFVSGVSRDVFFDTGTHLIARETTADGQLDYSGYRRVDGVQTPARVDLLAGGHEYKITVTRAEFNAPVDDAVFDFPRAQGAPLPDLSALMREVSKNQKTVEQMQKQYTCHLIAQETGTRPKTMEYEVFNIAGDEVRRLIAKDGNPLSEEAKKKEDSRFNKEFEKRTKEEAALAADPKKQAKQDAEDEAQISDFLRAERFSNARRERFRGQDVIAVDFGPNPDYKPKKAIESMVQKLAGVMWIDDKARDIARLEAHVDNSLKIAGGLVASLDKGSSFVFEQAMMNDEVWLPSYVEVHVEGHALLFLKLKANEIDRYTDYKKFHADSKIVAIDQ